MGPRSFWEFASTLSNLGWLLICAVIVFLMVCSFIIAPILLLLGVPIPFSP